MYTLEKHTATAPDARHLKRTRSSFCLTVQYSSDIALNWNVCRFFGSTMNWWLNVHIPLILPMYMSCYGKHIFLWVVYICKLYLVFFLQPVAYSAEKHQMHSQLRIIYNVYVLVIQLFQVWERIFDSHRVAVGNLKHVYCGVSKWNVTLPLSLYFQIISIEIWPSTIILDNNTVFWIFYLWCFLVFDTFGVFRKLAALNLLQNRVYIVSVQKQEFIIQSPNLNYLHLGLLWLMHWHSSEHPVRGGFISLVYVDQSILVSMKHVFVELLYITQMKIDCFGHIADNFGMSTATLWTLKWSLLLEFFKIFMT